MARSDGRLAEQFLAQAARSLQKHHLPRIEQCLARLSPEQIWWRPNEASNSVGNLVLHLAGNVRQWITSGLGGAPDRRERDREFAERGPIPGRRLAARLRKTVREACGVLRRLTSRDLARDYRIQKFNVSGLTAVLHVVEHFAHHSGQIIFATKLQCGEDLGFTRLPGSTAPRAGRRLPAV